VNLAENHDGFPLVSLASAVSKANDFSLIQQIYKVLLVNDLNR